MTHAVDTATRNSAKLVVSGVDLQLKLYYIFFYLSVFIYLTMLLVDSNEVTVFPSSRSMAVRSTQTTRNLPGGRSWRKCKAAKFTAYCLENVGASTSHNLRDSTACYRDNS
jgi:hypothetical protein